MNGPKYLELLKENHSHAIWYRSKVATDLLKKIKISALEWPGNSPDHNPIENLWTIIKDKVPYKQPS